MEYLSSQFPNANSHPSSIRTNIWKIIINEQSLGVQSATPKSYGALSFNKGPANSGEYNQLHLLGFMHFWSCKDLLRLYSDYSWLYEMFLGL